MKFQGEYFKDLTHKGFFCFCNKPQQSFNILDVISEGY